MNTFCISMLLYCTLFAHVFRNPCLPLASLSLDCQFYSNQNQSTRLHGYDRFALIRTSILLEFGISSMIPVYFQYISSLFPSIDCALIFLKLMSMNDCTMSNVISYLLLCFQFTFSLCMYTLYISIYMGSQELPSRPLSCFFLQSISTFVTSFRTFHYAFFHT